MANTQITAWSYSRLALFELCPLQYKLQNIDKVPSPPNKAMQRGNELHKQLANYILVKTAPKPAVLKDGQPGAVFAKQFDELRKFDRSHVIVEQQWGFNASWKACAYFGNGIWWRVILDVGLVYPDDTADVIDHKTGKKYATNEDQTRQFALSVTCRFPAVKAVTTRLWYVDSGQEEIAEYTKAEMPAVQSDLGKRVAKMLGAETFPPRPNEKCFLCNYSKSKGGQCKFG